VRAAHGWIVVEHFPNGPSLIGTGCAQEKPSIKDFLPIPVLLGGNPICTASDKEHNPMLNTGQLPSPSNTQPSAVDGFAAGPT